MVDTQASSVLLEEAPPVAAKLPPSGSSPRKRNSVDENNGSNKAHPTQSSKRPKTVSNAELLREKAPIDSESDIHDRDRDPAHAHAHASTTSESEPATVTAITSSDSKKERSTVASTASRNSNSSNNNNNNKITAATKTATTKTKTTATATATTTTTTTADEEILDLAETLGLKPGTQIEVQWEIHTDATDEDGDGDEAASGERKRERESTESTTAVSLHWWKATLLEHDGRTTDSVVAVRSLLYEARPDLGFPEESKEDVVFLGRDVLAASTDADSADWEANPEAVRKMPYRKVPDTNGGIQNQNGNNNNINNINNNLQEMVVCYSDDQLDDQLNELLMGAVRKNQEVWGALPAAQKALIAEKIHRKKEQLKTVLRARKHELITSETIRDILAQAF